MEKDLEYRLNFRNRKTKFGRPLYKNISVQKLYQEIDSMRFY